MLDVVNSTATPATGLPFASTALTVNGVDGVKMVIDWPSPAIGRRSANGPAVAVAVMTTDAPLASEAVSESVPAAVPSVQITLASPAALVVLVGLLTEPLAPMMVQLTTAPAIELPF